MLLQLASVFPFILLLSTSYMNLRSFSVYSAVKSTEKRKHNSLYSSIRADNTWPGIGHGYFKPFVLGGRSCGSNQAICWVANKMLLRTSYRSSGQPFCLAHTAMYYTKMLCITQNVGESDLNVIWSIQTYACYSKGNVCAVWFLLC